MLFRSRSPFVSITLVMMLAVFTAGCMTAKKKPEIRLARAAGDSSSSLAGGSNAGFGADSWSPKGAPGSSDFSMGGDVSRGGDGFGPPGAGNDFALDSTGTLPNSASMAGVEQGTFVADLEMIHFPYDSSDLTADWQVVLDGHAQWLASNPNVMIQVEGHCDDRGTEDYNTSLGQRRADVVREYLAGKGVDPNRMSTISYGEGRPLSYEGTEDAHMLNRRAMFMVYQSGSQTVAQGF